MMAPSQARTHRTAEDSRKMRQWRGRTAPTEHGGVARMSRSLATQFGTGGAGHAVAVSRRAAVTSFRRSSQPTPQGVEWGLLFPQANGDYQSPINLNSREAFYDPTLLESRLEPSYVVCRDCDVINDGHAVHVIVRSKSVVTGGPLPRQQEYELHEVCFHWGRENQRGSEHTVNFKAFPMELHLVHWNTSLFSSMEEALGRRHGTLIIALFVQIGKEHLGLRAVTDVLQDIQYKGRSKTIPCFNPNTLLPDPLLRDYWVYEGSLTVPPCCENVTWVLYRYPLTVSQVQMDEFRRLRSHERGAAPPEDSDGLLGDNFRPTQPLSERVVRAAFQ